MEKHRFSSTLFHFLNIMFFGKQLFALVAASLFTVSSAFGEYQIFTSTIIIFGFKKRKKKNWLITTKSHSKERLECVSRS